MLKGLYILIILTQAEMSRPFNIYCVGSYSTGGLFLISCPSFFPAPAHLHLEAHQKTSPAAFAAGDGESFAYQPWGRVRG